MVEYMTAWNDETTYWMVPSGTTTAGEYTWQRWVQNTGTATNQLITVQDNIWSGWTTNVTTFTYDRRQYRVEPAPELTLEEQAHVENARRNQLAEHRRQIEERAAQMAAAEERAHALLLEVLSDEQTAEYAKDRAFTVKVRDPAKPRRFRTFRIHHGRAGNVLEIGKDGNRLGRYCIHPRGNEPDEDVMVAQKLMLETDLDSFLRIANWSSA